MSDRTRCWFGAVTGHTVPMARMAIAGMRATRLSDEDIGAEYFLDRHAEPDTGLVADVCKAMATALRSLGKRIRRYHSDPTGSHMDRSDGIRRQARQRRLHHRRRLGHR